VVASSSAVVPSGTTVRQVSVRAHSRPIDAPQRRVFGGPEIQIPHGANEGVQRIPAKKSAAPGRPGAQIEQVDAICARIVDSVM